MSEPKDSLKKYYPVFLLAVVVAVVIYLIICSLSTVVVILNISKALIGLGLVILVHEFGHFVVAKLSDVNVEAFSIGFPPTLAGIQRTEEGFRIRILPALFHKGDEQVDNERFSFLVGKKGRAGETEYRIGLIPIGGFVKMLGQEDIGPNKTTDDPRAYGNKTVGIRMGVIAAGVFLNIISALVIFMAVFLIGIKRIPPVIGAVEPNLPAARAGLRAGDEIIEIAGKTDNLEFIDIMMMAALSGRDEEVLLKVRHEDGSIESYALVAEKAPGPKAELKRFGILAASSLTIAEVSDHNALFVKTGLLSNDLIRAVDDKEVKSHWQLREIIQDAFVPTVTVSAQRTDKAGKCRLIESQIRLTLNTERTTDETEPDFGHIYSMVPRLKITEVLSKLDANDVNSPDRGDIIITAGDIENPTYKQLRKVTEEHEDKELTVKVLRQAPDGTERTIIATVVPRRSKDSGKVMIGIGIALDLGQAVVADIVATGEGAVKLAIPRGALITAVDGVRVSNFYDIAREIGRSTSERISIEYRLDEQIAGDVVLNVGRLGDLAAVKTTFAELVPFKPLQRLYKADGSIGAVVMGYNKTIMSIVRAYVTLQRFVGGGVSAKSFMGPVGLIDISYRILKDYPLIDYIYILGLISVFIAVFNLLPILPFDGGHIVFLLVEKIKGSPVSERVQVVVLYTGLALVGALALYVTFNDIVRSFLR